MIRWRIAICLCLLGLVVAQNLQIKASLIQIPDIDEDYNIVNTVIYPVSEQRFKSTLSRDHFVKKIMQIREAELRAGKPLDRPESIQRKAEMQKKIDQVNKQSKGKDSNKQQPAKPAAPASVPKIKQKIQIQKNKIKNEGKQIIWRAFDILPISPTIIEDGVQFKLKKTEPTSSTKEKPKKVKDIDTKKKEIDIPAEIVSQKPKLVPKILKQNKVEQKKLVPIVPNVQKSEKTESPVDKPIEKPEKQFHPNLQFASQPHINPIKQRKDLIIIVIVIIVAFLIFLVVQYKRTKKESVWSNLSNQLNSYQSSSIQQDDEEEIENLESEEVSKQKEELQGEPAY